MKWIFSRFLAVNVLLFALFSSSAYSKNFPFSIPQGSSDQGENCCDYVAAFSSLGKSGLDLGKVKLGIEGSFDEGIDQGNFLIAAHPHRDLAAPREFRIYTSIKSTIDGSINLVYTLSCNKSRMNCPKDDQGNVIEKVVARSTIAVTCGDTPVKAYNTPFSMDDAKAIVNFVQMNESSIPGRLSATITNETTCNK